MKERKRRIGKESRLIKDRIKEREGKKREKCRAKKRKQKRCTK